METLEILAPMCHLLLSYISGVNELAAVGGFLMVASAFNSAHRRLLTSASVVQPRTELEASLADSRVLSSRAEVGVLRGKVPKLPRELWTPEFDEKLKNGIGKSLAEQNIVIEEILDAEPRLNRAAVVTRFVRKLLNHASNSNVQLRESAIWQIMQLQPALDRETIGTQLDQIARAALPPWVNSSFWTREIDPILLIGIRNAHQEFEAVLDRISLLYPSVPVCEIRQRHSHYRSKNRHAEFVAGDEWPIEADQVLREGIARESKTEREAILRASRQHKELRLGAIQQRMKVLQRRFTAAQEYQRFTWSEEINRSLLEASKNSNLAQAVASIATQHGRSREMVYKHCERLGIPRQQRKPVRQWDAADREDVPSLVEGQGG